jgi:hypothetical protein
LARQSNQAIVAKLDHQRKKRFQLGLVAISAFPKKIAWFTGKNDHYHSWLT